VFECTWVKLEGCAGKTKKQIKISSIICSARPYCAGYKIGKNVIAGNVARTGNQRCMELLVGNPEEKRTLGIPRLR
jgi:hypothetical protein